MPSARTKRSLILLGALLLVGRASVEAADSAQAGFHLRDGDRVAFYGDSITDQRLYTAFVETYVVTRFPNLNVRFINAGWGGDRVTGGHGGSVDVRLSRDVIVHRPTVMTIMLGMNDGGVRPYDAGLFNTFSSGYDHIVQTVKQSLPGIRITAILPSPYDDVTRAPLFAGGYNGVLIRYGQFVKELAAREHLLVADLNTPLVAATVEAVTMDKKLAEQLNPDRVHPSPAGHLIMAQALLQAWDAPATVAVTEIDAESRRVVRAENTTVAGLNLDQSLSWTQTDKSLPMPVDLQNPVTALAVRCSSFMSALNQQTLKVAGLGGERYLLKVDGEPVGTFSREELSAGVNLAAIATPQSKQAQSVHELTVKRGEAYWIRWRQIQLGFEKYSGPQRQAVLEALDSLEAALRQEQRAAAQPRPRRYELVAQ